MGCLYCGKRLALLRRLSDGEFCTREHREAYHKEQQQLAIKRLMEAHAPAAKPTVRPVLPPLFDDEKAFLPDPPELPPWGRKEINEPADNGLASPPEISRFLSVAPPPRPAGEHTLRSPELILATAALILPDAIGLANRTARTNDPLPMARTIQPSNPPPRVGEDLYVQQIVPAICRPQSLLRAGCGNAELAAAPQVRTGLESPEMASESACPTKANTGFSKVAQCAFNSGAEVSAVLACARIVFRHTPILSEAIIHWKRSSIAGDPIPMADSVQPANPPPAAWVEPSIQESVPSICRPKSSLTVDCGDAQLEAVRGWVPPEPPMAESLVNIAGRLSFQVASLAAIAGLTKVAPEVHDPLPLKPKSNGRKTWYSAIVEAAGHLPMADVTALAVLEPRILGNYEATPIVLSPEIEARTPGFVPQESRERSPRRIGRLQRQVAVSKLALRSKTGILEALREEQVLAASFRFETVHSRLRFHHGWRTPDVNERGQPVRLDLMPDAQRSATVGGANVLRNEEPPPAVAPWFRGATSIFAATFHPHQSEELRLHPLSAVPRSMESARPAACRQEEFLAWLQVPLFDLAKSSARGLFANLAGRTGLAEILASPRAARPAKSDDVEPSFGAMRPLLGESRLTTIRPPLFTRKERFLSNAEEQLRNSLSTKFKSGGFPFWRETFSGRKWIALSLPIIAVIVFQATLHMRNSMAAGKPEARISERIAETDEADSSPAPDVAVRPVGGKRASRESAASVVDRAVEKPVAIVEQPKKAESAPTYLGTIQRFFDQRILNLKLNLAERASIDLTDDFRSGLAGWEGRGDWARTWTFDRAGLLRPGQLALYQASMGLSDYTLEFNTTAERGYVGWVVRARDLNNYYGMRLQVMKSGPGTQGSLEHWVVSGGREHSRKYVPTRTPVWEANVTHVRVAIEGTSFTTFVNGQIADTWTDSRIDSGGVGFFNDKGGDARIHRMSVSHQIDAIGKLCAMLAPHDLIYKPRAGEGRPLR